VTNPRILCIVAQERMDGSDVPGEEIAARDGVQIQA